MKILHLQISTFSDMLPKIGNIDIKTGIMGKNTSVSLGSYFDEFIKGKIATGRYNNASEVIRCALRLLEEEEDKRAALKASIREGDDSGVAVNFDPDTHLEKLKLRRTENV